MQNVTPGQRPDNDAGYLEMMTAVIFMGGLNRQVVMNKWDGFLRAFQGFDVDQVALFTAQDVERLSQDEGIIRYQAKIQAVVDNAQVMQQMAQEHGSFGIWLRNTVAAQGVDAAADAIAQRFKYMSQEGSRRYLYAVGEDVGEVPEKIRMKYGPGM
jgi:3-methyladenine DNA glycosylase Tag